MIPRLPGTPRDQPAPLALVVEDDPGVLEALKRTLESGHFRVVAVADGEDALRRARAEAPELVIAGWRLPKRTGLELCDALRRESEGGEVPIVLLAPGDDPELRVEGLAHGADEVVAKPCPPRELIARAQRLVMRARQLARHRRRAHELERDLHKTLEDVRRAREEAAEERGLRALAAVMNVEVARTLDPDVLDARLLREACRQTGVQSAALLEPDETGVWRVGYERGELPERWAGFTLPAPEVCIEWLQTFGRPLRREDLERVSRPAEAMAPLAARGVAVLALLAGADGVPEAVFACEDREDGRPLRDTELDRLAVLCEAASAARTAARRFRVQQDHALELLADPAGAGPEREAAVREARERLLPLAAAMGVGPAERGTLALALGLGPRVWDAPARAALARLAAGDPTRRLARLGELLDDAVACERGEPGAAEDPLAWLASTGLRYQALRLAGRSVFECWRTTASWLGVHAHPALRHHIPEALEPTG